MCVRACVCVCVCVSVCVCRRVHSTNRFQISEDNTTNLHIFGTSTKMLVFSCRTNPVIVSLETRITHRHSYSESHEYPLMYDKISANTRHSDWVSHNQKQ